MSDQLYNTHWPQRHILLALGSNHRSHNIKPHEFLHQALQLLEARALVVERLSKFYLTPSFPPGSGENYVNAAALITGGGPPKDLLDTLHDVENILGRTRTQRWGPRVIDLDLLAVGNTVFPNLARFSHWRDLPLERQMSEAPDELILPHPRIQDRAFVLVPLADIAPEWQHPVTGQTVREMLAALPVSAFDGIAPLKEE